MSWVELWCTQWSALPIWLAVRNERPMINQLISRRFYIRASNKRSRSYTVSRTFLNVPEELSNDRAARRAWSMDSTSMTVLDQKMRRRRGNVTERCEVVENWRTPSANQLGDQVYNELMPLLICVIWFALIWLLCSTSFWYDTIQKRRGCSLLSVACMSAINGNGWPSSNHIL